MYVCMATTIAPELKEKLMSRGIWSDFVRRREDIRRERGVNNRWGSVAALEELAPDLADEVRPKGNRTGIRRPNRPKGPEEGAGAVSSPVPPSASEGVEVPSRASGGVTREMFAGRSCSNMTALIWAVESTAFSGVRAEEAPSAFAWAIYSMLVASPSTKADVMKVLAGKIALKAGEDDGGSGRFDGEGEYSMADAIAKEAGE